MFAACLAMTAATAQERAPDYAAIVAAPDRTDADLQTDKRRDPVKLLSFTGARPSMKVLDMGAGGGYSTELMARFACARLSQSYLPKSRSDFSATFTTIAFDNSSLRWLEIST
jgi:predicted methyltransferase